MISITFQQISNGSVVEKQTTFHGNTEKNSRDLFQAEPQCQKLQVGKTLGESCSLGQETVIMLKFDHPRGTERKGKDLKRDSKKGLSRTGYEREFVRGSNKNYNFNVPFFYL